MAKIVIRTHGPAVSESEEVLQKALLSALKRLQEGGVVQLDAWIYKGEEGAFREVEPTPEILKLIGQHYP